MRRIYWRAVDLFDHAREWIESLKKVKAMAEEIKRLKRRVSDLES